MKKKILCSLLALLVINLSFPHVAWASGPNYCGAEGDGSNVTWTFDDVSGALTISGSGKMKDFAFRKAPWYGQVNNIKSITINDGVTSIGERAFDNCTSLESITIPSSVTSIGNFALNQCTSLKSITIPNSVTSIGGYAFQYSALTSITIPSSVTSMGRDAFAGCKDLKSITIPSSDITSIGDYAFAGCTSLTSITIPSSVTSIGDYAFYKCEDLTSITIPSSVTSIGESAFRRCTDLKTFFYKEELNIERIFDDGPAGKNIDVVEIAYTVNAEQNTSGKTEVTLASSAKDVTIPCNAMGEGYNITANNTADGNKVTITHDFSTIWSKDDNNHWHECAYCKERQDETPHSFKLEHDSDKHWEECSICKKEKNKASHNFSEENFGPAVDNLGGTKHTCTDCGYEYWKGLTRDTKYNQTNMPDGETIYHYCTHNGLAAETTVDVGDGQTLKVFLQDPLGVLKKNDTDTLGISVTYIEKGSARYNELMSQVDADHPIEHINFFEVYPTINGEKIEGGLSDYVYMEYEIPEGWDESDLEMILVQDGDDQKFDEKILEIDGKKYLVMWKNHFSPYAMIDKLTDEEKAALIAQQIENINSGESTNNSKYLSNQVKTGDNSRSMVLASSAMLIITGLFLEVCMKKKEKCQKASIVKCPLPSRQRKNKRDQFKDFDFK